MTSVSYGAALRLHAERDPDRTALVFCEERRSREELERASNRWARELATLGVSPGDRVTLALPNGPAFFEACAGIWKLGATPQPVSARLPARERHAIVELADPPVVVGADPAEHPGRRVLPPDHVPSGGHAPDPLPDRVPRHARAMTSGGSTGRPKLIVETAPARCDPLAPENGMRLDGVTLVPGPLHHAGPFITAWQTLLTGGTAVVMPRFDAAEALRLIEAHRVEWVLFVPTMMQRIWRLPAAEREARDLSSLRRVMCTGAPSPAWLKRAWIEWLGPERIWEAYGGTERIAGTLISGTEWLAHSGSVGKPAPGRVRVLDPTGRDCPPEQVGEIHLRAPEGPGSTYRYVGAEPRVTADGWETLGDLGYLDAEGWLYVVDRRSDLIVTGGANVYPAEVEAALDAHASVRSCAVIGLPDDDLGQRVHAIVDAPGGIDEAALRAHLEARIAAWKRPRSFEWVAEPLRDDAGKLNRSALREARIARTS